MSLFYKSIPSPLEDLFLEQVNLELVIRENQVSQETANKLKIIIGRLELAIKEKYGEVLPETKKYIYLRFLKRELELRRWNPAKPDCLICKHMYENITDLESDCQLHPERYNEIMDEDIAMCEDYFPISKTALEESKRKREQEIEVVRQFIAELEQKHLKIIKHIHI